MAVDIAIKNCKLVTTEGISPTGIAVKGDKIVAIAGDDYLPEAENVIDAKGNFVIPGLVDPHTHLLYPPTPEEEWGRELQSETKAAASGGVTTVIHLLFQAGPGSLVEAGKKVKEVYEANGYVDLGLNAPIFNMPQIKEMRDALEWGMPCFKFLVPYKGREALAGLPGIDDGILYMGFEQIGKLVKEGYKTFARIHPESIEVFFAIEDRCKEEGYEPKTYVEVRENFIELEALQRCIAFAKVTECPLYVVHQTIKEGPETVAKAKLEGLDIVDETCPQYLVLNTENTDKMLSKVNPPIRRKEDNEALWKGIADGIITFMGTDHAPVDKAQKGTDFWRAVVGMAGLETWLPIMLSEGVNKGRITLEKLVEICCYNPAVKYCLAPKKGTIAVGSDADLVIVDLDKKAKVNAKNMYTRAGYSVYEGWEFKGWPVMTMLRGKVIAQENKIVGDAGFGRYVPAKVK
jgi:dihydroorotase (multifunctional complex type)